MICPCGSQKNYAQCCEPFITGNANPPTPEALMRSRYTAFVVGDIVYLKDTLAPESRNGFDEADARAWAKSDWAGLEIISAQDDTVEFIAKYRKKGKTFEHHEVSKFKKKGERWYFLEGDSHTHEEGKGHHHHHEPRTPVIREEPKVGRNDPCPCGSGKKFKKCCAA